MDLYTLSQLLMAPADPARAREIGQMGYMQWLAGLPGQTSYPKAAARALARAGAFDASDPAVAEFCRLLRVSLRDGPAAPLGLALPAPRRRGGARERRRAL